MSDPKFIFRFIDGRNARYLHAADVAAFIRELAGGEETDVRNRLNAAADNLVHAWHPAKEAMSAAAFELKTCPVCRGSGQYCTAYPKHFSPCGECNGTGKVRTYAELLRAREATP